MPTPIWQGSYGTKLMPRFGLAHSHPLIALLTARLSLCTTPRNKHRKDSMHAIKCHAGIAA